MADFIAVENADNYAYGYLIANGNVYPAVSGSGSAFDCPEGTYYYGEAMDLEAGGNNYRWMTDARTDKEATKERAAKFKKFAIGTARGGKGNIYDKRAGRSRVYIRFHYAHFGATLGCIGYMDNAAEDALKADKNKTITVKYYQTIEEVQKAVKAKVKGGWFWKPPKIIVPGTKARLAGLQSETRAMAKVVEGDKRVLVGPNQRELAHQSAPIEGGFEIAEGSRNVFVGPERHPVSAVSHLTTDGTPLESGEPSVEIGLIG